MSRVSRYFRLLGAFGRFCLANELAFRGNFLVKLLVEVLWLGILLIFYQTLFANTSNVGGWDAHEYLFFLGCYYALEGLIETLFLENAIDFADMVRTGNLDFYLLKPIDEQFLVTLRKIDWSTATKVPLGRHHGVRAGGHGLDVQPAGPAGRPGRQRLDVRPRPRRRLPPAVRVRRRPGVQLSRSSSLRYPFGWCATRT